MLLYLQSRSQGKTVIITQVKSAKKIAPVVMRGLLAGSSWLLHIKQMYIKNQDRISWDYDISGSCVLLCLPSVTE